MLDLATQHLRHAARSLRRHPGFTLAAIATLALGVGATTAVFSVFSTAILEPLPYPNADRLAAISQRRGEQEISVSWPDLMDLRARTTTFAQLAAFRGRSFNITGEGTPERLRGQMVTAELFGMLGVRPLLGRAFRADEDAVNAAPVVAIGYRLWQQRFAGNPAVLGRSVTLSGQPYTIVAVMPDGFRFPDGVVYGPAEVWVTMSGLGTDDRTTRDSHPGLVAMGLLKPGYDLAAGRRELELIAGQLAGEYPVTNGRIGVLVRSGVDAIVGNLRGALGTVLGAAALILLIACANVAGLLLARASARRREIAVRNALGASRRHLAAQLMAEGVCLAGAGGALGLLLTVVLVRAGGAWVAALPRLETVHVDLRALALVSALIGITALIFGLVPAFFGGAPAGAITNRSGTGDAPATRARRALVAGEMAVALMVLIGAALLLQSFVKMRADRGGVDPRGVLTFNLSLPENRYDGDPAAAILRQLQERLGALPGVTDVAGISVLPYSGSGAQSGIRTVESPRTPESERTTDVQVVLPGYFKAMGIALLKGRVLTAADGPNGPTSVVVDERLADAFWPGQDPLGRRLNGWGFDTMTVVGVVRHVKNYGVAADSRQELYVAHAQRPFLRMTMVVRTAGDPAALLPAVRRAVTDLDAQLPIYGESTMDDVMDATVAGPRLAALLATAFGVVALILAAVGLYGVMAYMVATRTREIGVRMAVGATSGRVVRMVVRQALALSLAGVAIGVSGSLVATRLITSQLFGVSPADPVAYGVLPAVLLLVAVSASLVPAIRAARVSPLAALSEE